MSDAIPLEVDYDDSEVREDAAEESWVEGAIVCVEYQGCKQKLWDPKPDKNTGEIRPGKDLALQHRFRVLDPETEAPVGGTIFHNTGLPVRNPNCSDHVKHPFYCSSRGPWAEMCEAFFPDAFGGVGAEEAARQRGLLAKETWNNMGADLVGKRIVATIKYSGDFTNLVYLRPDLRDGEEFTPVSELRSKRYAKAEEAPAEAAPKKGKKKKSKKK